MTPTFATRLEDAAGRADRAVSTGRDGVARRRPPTAVWESVAFACDTIVGDREVVSGLET